MRRDTGSLELSGQTLPISVPLYLGFLTDHAQLVRGDEDLDSGPPASAASTLNHAPKSSSQPLITLFCKVNLSNESTG